MTYMDPEQVLREARELTDSGAYAEALERYCWFHENAVTHEPSLYGVRAHSRYARGHAWATSIRRLGQHSNASETPMPPHFETAAGIASCLMTLKQSTR